MRAARGIERRLAARRGADALGDAVGVDVLEQVAARARLQRADDPRAVGERRQHDHRRLRALGEDAARRLDAVEDRHVEVHQHDVGRQPRGTARRPRRRRRRSPTSSTSSSAEISRPSPSRMTPWSSASSDADHRAGTSSSTVVPSPGRRADRQRAVAPARRGPRAASGRRGRSAALRSRSAAAKPRPSSATTSRVVAGSRPRDLDPHRLRLAVRLRVADRLARDAVDERVARRRAGGGGLVDVQLRRDARRRERAEQVAERHLQAGRLEVRRMDLDEQRAQVADALAQRGGGVAQRAGLGVARRGARRPRPAARARTRRPRGPARRRRAGRRRSGGAPATRPRPRSPAAARARGARAAAAAPSTTRAGAGAAAARATPPSSGGASARSSRSALALTESKRW